MDRTRSDFLKPRRWARALLIAQAALALSGCSSSTSLVNMWRDPTFTRPPLTKVLVIAVKKDPTQRRIWEDGLVAEMTKRGAAAVPSYQIFPDAAPDTEQVIQAVQERGFEGVLVTHKLATQTNEVYVPGYVRRVPATGYDPWYGTYYTYWRKIYEPGYTETEKVVRYQTDVWSTQQRGRMIWSGTSESIDPSSSQDVNREISALIVPELSRVGMLPRKK